MSKVKGPQILTGNELLTGVAIFWDGRGWSDDPSRAVLIRDDGEKLRLLARAEATPEIVVGPYLTPADERGPTALRERIRTAGPTVRLDLGKQAATRAPARI